MRAVAAAILAGCFLYLGGCLGGGDVRTEPAVWQHPEPDSGSEIAGARWTPPVLSATTSTRSYRLSGDLSRPPRVEGRLDTPLKRQWNYIVLHHSADEVGSAEAFDRYHRRHNGWLGVGYNFVIGNGHGAPDGLVQVTFRWEKQIQGAHAGHDLYNQHGIGICMVGDFENGYPTRKQMEALVGLINFLQERCRIPTDQIVGHCHVRPGGTRCPGKHFPWYELFAHLKH